MTLGIDDPDDHREIEKEIEQLKNDPERAHEAEDRIRSEFAEKYGHVSGFLMRSRFKVVRDLGANALSLYEMLVDPDYTVPWTTKAQIIAALAYFISPVDVIPDAVPVVGYLDDALVVAYVVHNLSEDVAKYRTWRQEQGRPLPGTS